MYKCECAFLQLQDGRAWQWMLEVVFEKLSSVLSSFVVDSLLVYEQEKEEEVTVDMKSLLLCAEISIIHH